MDTDFLTTESRNLSYLLRKPLSIARGGDCLEAPARPTATTDPPGAASTKLDPMRTQSSCLDRAGVQVNVPEVKNFDVTDVELSAGSQADTGWNRHVVEIFKSINDLQLLLPTLVNAIEMLTPNSYRGSSTLSY